jgi:hypothetical protein
MGLQSGRTLMAWKDHKNRVVRWYIWSVVLGSSPPPATTKRHSEIVERIK